jgi:hypothetical protein
MAARKQMQLSLVALPYLFKIIEVYQDDHENLLNVGSIIYYLYLLDQTQPHCFTN